jgi:NitT/TauT family transport system ATP-binding protein
MGPAAGAPLEQVGMGMGGNGGGGPAKLEVDRATKHYETRSGLVHALEDYSMGVEDGELVCVLGPSGCGKSTLLWAMAGLHDLTRGEVRLDGEPVVRPHPQIGMVFQEANLLPWRSLIKNIHLPFEIKRLDPADHRETIDHLLERVGLLGFESKYPRELSGGMQQRASIVRSLSVDPSLLLMDEPFGALDAFTRDEMNLLLQEIWLETGKTIVFITHNIAEAVFLANRVYVMSPRPGRLQRVFEIDLPRPRPLEVTTERHFIELVAEIKGSIDHGAGIKAGSIVEMDG